MAKTELKKEVSAQIDKVWEALTTPDLIKKFWSPPGMKTTFVEITKLEVGGAFTYQMENDDGWKQIVKCMYAEIEKPTKLKFEETLVDEDGNQVPASYYGMPGDEIKTSVTEINLEDLGDKTKVTMIFDYGDDKSNEFASGGWGTMLSNLAEMFV